MGYSMNGFAVNGCNGPTGDMGAPVGPTGSDEVVEVVETGQAGLFDNKKKKQAMWMAVGAGVGGLLIGAGVGYAIGRRRKRKK